MKDLKITKGEWKSIFRNKHDMGVRSDKGYICFMTMPTHFTMQDARYEEELEECKSDAELIADAGNTTQKCSLLPSELLKQNEELREALSELVHLHGCEQEGLLSGQPTPEQWYKAVEEAEQALKNSER